VVAGPFEGVVHGDDVVVAVRLDDPYLVGTDLFVYAKFIYVSDGWSGGLMQGEFEWRGRIGRKEKPGSYSGTDYTRRRSCEVSVKSA
jgi:hypothetical protein